MGQYNFNNKKEEPTELAEETNMQSFSEATDTILGIIVRLCGLVLLFIGLWIAIQVFNEALALYKNPENIERIAVAIERGSNIDKSLVPLKQTLMGEDEQQQEPSITQAKTAALKNDANNIRVSYFVAWVVELLLLILLARISLMAVKTGGELALYDAQVKKLARQIVKNSRQNRE